MDDELYSVSQGYVLGPLLFILCTADVIWIVSNLGVKVHRYADDTQLHISGSVEGYDNKSFENDSVHQCHQYLDVIRQIKTK